MKKIRTNSKVKQHTDGKFYFVSREILKFIDKGSRYIAVYQEKLLDVVKDENDNDVFVVICNYPQVDSEFSKQKVRSLFKNLNDDILNTDNFDEKFDELQVQAMIYDTINQTELGRYGTKEWVKF